MIEVGIASIFIGMGISSFTQISVFGIVLFASAIGGVCTLFFKLSSATCIVLLVLFGALYTTYRIQTITLSDIGSMQVTGKVVSVNRRLTDTVFILKDERGARLQIYTAKQILPGDRVTVKGEVVLPEDFEADSGRVFAYKDFLASKGVSAIVYRGEVEIVGRKWSMLRTATQIRFAIADTFSQFISFPSDGILAGMLVGYQGGIPEEAQKLFRDTGVLHVLVLSGYNIMLLAGFVSVVLTMAPYRLRLYVTGIAIALLVLISGAGVASIRAGIMGSIALLAGLSIRTYNPLRALLIASCAFFLISPQTPLVDPGFHLSFIATFCMIALAPKGKRFVSWVPESRFVPLQEILLLSILMPLFMLPYTLYFSGVVPLAAIPANIILAIVNPVLLLLGIVLLVVSPITSLASIVGVVISQITDFVVNTLTILSTLPIWNTPSVSGWGVLGIYGALCFVLFRTEIMSVASQIQR